MTLDEFCAEQRREIELFRIMWRKEYQSAEGDEMESGEWDEQFLAWQETKGPSR